MRIVAALLIMTAACSRTPLPEPTIVEVYSRCYDHGPARFEAARVEAPR